MKGLVSFFIIFCAGLMLSHAQIGSNEMPQNFIYFSHSWACNDGREAWLANIDEILFADSLVKREIQKDNARIKVFRRMPKERSDFILQGWNGYHRQVCSDWEEGRKVLKFQYLLFDSTFSSEKIRNDFITVIGGGNSVWNVTVDIERKKIVKIDFD
jgi:hypothetical protein